MPRSRPTWLDVCPWTRGRSLEEIQTDLERVLRIDGETARAIGVQVLSSTSVRFVVTTAFPLDRREVLLDSMEAVIRRWRLREAGMADPEPSTPETEYLTDILEDRLVQRFAAPDAQQRNSTAFFRCAGTHVWVRKWKQFVLVRFREGDG